MTTNSVGQLWNHCGQQTLFQATYLNKYDAVTMSYGVVCDHHIQNDVACGIWVGVEIISLKLSDTVLSKFGSL